MLPHRRRGQQGHRRNQRLPTHQREHRGQPRLHDAAWRRPRWDQRRRAVGPVVVRWQILVRRRRRHLEGHRQPALSTPDHKCGQQATPHRRSPTDCDASKSFLVGLFSFPNKKQGQGGAVI
eukprot:scaffold24837_cov105-Isochrysis_galbana.AAC.5